MNIKTCYTNIDMINDAMNFAENYYNNKQRYYHNINHITSMLKLMSKYLRNIDLENTLPLYENEIIISLLIIFHDIIYNPKQDDTINIDESIKLFDDFINEQKRLQYIIKDYIIDYVKQLILCIKNHCNDNIHIELKIISSLFLDLDLYVLSNKNNKYKEYSDNIRKEYDHYNDIDYIKGRTEILNKLYNKAANNNLYKLNIFKKLNTLARLNIADEIVKLNNGIF